MPAPTSHSESSLLGLMEVELGPVGVSLGLLETDALQQAVWAVQRLLGRDDVADATNMALLEAAARWEAWKAAEAAAINSVDLKSDGDEIKLSQRLAGVRARLASAESAYYVQKAAADAASGAGGFVAFATISGCRGR